MKKVTVHYNVILWDFNKDSLEFYDVMPYLRETYHEDVHRKAPVFLPAGPVTRETLREFILSASRYRFWSRCEYEVIVTGWPKQNREEKLDVHRQVEANIEVITDLLAGELGI